MKSHQANPNLLALVPPRGLMLAVVHNHVNAIPKLSVLCFVFIAAYSSLFWFTIQFSLTKQLAQYSPGVQLGPTFE